jgi:hypothetical protein
VRFGRDVYDTGSEGGSTGGEEDRREEVEKEEVAEVVGAELGFVAVDSFALG